MHLYSTVYNEREERKKENVDIKVKCDYLKLVKLGEDFFTGLKVGV